MSSRHKSREIALQILYQMDLSQQSSQVARTHFVNHFEHQKENMVFAMELVDGVEKSRAEIDAKLEHYSQHWKLGRMAPIDRNILRLGIYELMQKITPSAIILNEAIELAKKFGQNDTPQFINGILDAIQQELEKLVIPDKK